MKAVVFHELGKPLVIEEVDLAQGREGAGIVEAVGEGARNIVHPNP